MARLIIRPQEQPKSFEISDHEARFPGANALPRLASKCRETRHLGPVTLVPFPYTSGPFPETGQARKIGMGEGMQVSGVEKKTRRAGRVKAVLPVRIKGTDSTG